MCRLSHTLDEKKRGTEKTVCATQPKNTKIKYPKIVLTNENNLKAINPKNSSIMIQKIIASRFQD